MASHLKIQVDKYSAYESGQEDIPASILVEIAQKFGIETSVLLTGEQPSNEYFYGNPCGQGCQRCNAAVIINIKVLRRILFIKKQNRFS